jgi:hypothetical protein
MSYWELKDAPYGSLATDADLSHLRFMTGRGFRLGACPSQTSSRRPNTRRTPEKPGRTLESPSSQS